MNIFHGVASIDVANGGPSKSVSDLAICQVKQGAQVTIFTNLSSEPYLLESPLQNLTLFFTRKKNLKKDLNSILDFQNHEFCHIHGIWQNLVHQVVCHAKVKKIPYIIAPRGMLEPWALSNGKWKKKIAMTLFQRNDLDGSSCIHTTAKMEAENVRGLGFKNPIAVIPNGINLSDYPLKKQDGNNSDKRTLLFLSRIHPKKGIEILLEAWQLIDRKLRQNWQIEIAGNGESRYIASLQNLINDKKLLNVNIVGPYYGNAKIDAYHRASVFVLPTYSENFGVVIAEALACGVPVITTNGAPWKEINTCDAGFWIDIGVKPLVKALTEVMSLSESELLQMGCNGRKLVENNYSIESVTNKLNQLYRWILEEKEKPEFVYTK